MVARIRAFPLRMRLRKRNDLGVTSTYSSMSMYSIDRSRLIRSELNRNPSDLSIACNWNEDKP